MFTVEEVNVLCQRCNGFFPSMKPLERQAEGIAVTE
jgi:hypothetical protein